MEFQNLKVDDYPSFLSLYNSAFPASERREYKDERHLAEFIKMKGGKFKAFTLKDGDVFLGFLSYWTFEGFTYVEHFAVDPGQRGKRLGTLMLHHLFEVAGPDVLLEVELPTTEEARRRIGFYERNGFRKREEIKYLQPPYAPGKPSLELLLMTHGEVDLHNRNALKTMLREVYNVEHA